MNIPLLLQIADHIAKQPEALDMSMFFGDCGTVFCIGGLACLIMEGPSAYVRHKTPPYYTPDTRARNHLELSMFQSERLFYLDHWPVELEREYELGGAEERAAVAVHRIHHFIATGE